VEAVAFEAITAPASYRQRKPVLTHLVWEPFSIDLCVSSPRSPIRWYLDHKGNVVEQGRVSKILAFRGIERTPIEEAEAGDNWPTESKIDLGRRALVLDRRPRRVLRSRQRMLPNPDFGAARTGPVR
jgi:hypothetical protein